MFRFVSTGALALVLLAAPLAGHALDTQSGEWTATDPPINLVHIDFGEINRHGEAVGYHHRPNGVDPSDAKVTDIVQPADANGVYRARVSLRDPDTGEWI
ncbi:MAG: EndoU domain-containing protein, partial [Stellaceae bacterium]